MYPRISSIYSVYEVEIGIQCVGVWNMGYGVYENGYWDIGCLILCLQFWVFNFVSPISGRQIVDIQNRCVPGLVCTSVVCPKWECTERYVRILVCRRVVCRQWECTNRYVPVEVCTE